MNNLAPALPKRSGFKRVLGAFDMTLFTVCAILVVDTLAASAAIGPSSLGWWLITLLFFFIPYGLITAELGAAYPQEGGIQGWVRRAYGDNWAARVTWCYWVNVALWMPSAYILFAGMFSQLFWTEMTLREKITLAIGISWLTVVIGILSLDIAKWIPNIGAVVKAAIMLMIGGAGIVYVINHGSANDLSWPRLLPSWDAALGFLPVIVYNFLGFELMSGAGEEMSNPAHDVPIAVITAGALISLFYLLATFGILAALPLKDIGLIEGLLDTISKLFGGNRLLILLVGIGALFSFIANLVTWSIGANRSAMAAASEGELPQFFALMHSRTQTPVGAYILMGLLGTSVIILYGFISKNAEDLFWALFAFSSIIFLLPYLLLFPAFLKLRRIDAGTPRPYRFPGGSRLAKICAAICTLFIAQAILFFFWIPNKPMDWAKVWPILAGAGGTVLVGEIVVQAALRRKARG
jgi:glutamate:GABA antiporter